MVIFFDIDNTLIDHIGSSKKGAEFLCKKYNLHKKDESFYSFWDRITGYYYDEYLAGKFTNSEQRRERIKASFERNMPDNEADSYFAEYLSVYEATWELFDDVIPCLEKLSDFKMGIITDGGIKQQTSKLKQTNIEKYFDIVLTADVACSAKPESKFFKMACELADEQEDKCWYIGDLLEKDAIGATNAGLKGIWLNRVGIKTNHDIPEFSNLHQFSDFILKNNPPNL
ncbi:MAG: HAD family hydrolase [bacterium]|nr:HAD family hydrolase [bacterium]